MKEIIAQSIGMVAAVIAISSFQCRSTKKLFLLQCISAFLFTTHFLLLGAYAGFAQNGLGFLRAVFLYNREREWARSPFVFWGLMVSFVLCGAVTFENIFSLLPVAAMLVSTIFMWTGDGKKLRTAQLFAVSPLWLTYNITVFSISGILTESFNIVSVIISFLRMRKKGFSE